MSVFLQTFDPFPSTNHLLSAVLTVYIGMNELVCYHYNYLLE